MNPRVWAASTHIRVHLKAFFSRLLEGKLGRNIRHGPEALAEAHHQMLCTEASVSSTAMSMGLAHTTLTRKLHRVGRGEVWNALSMVMDSMLGVKESLLIADFTHLEYTGKDLLGLTTGTKQGDAFKVLAASSGRAICYLAPKSMLDFKEDLLWDLLQRAGSGRVFVADGDATAETVLDLAEPRIEPGSTVYTDNYASYEALDALYRHEVVNHFRGEYARGEVHINTCEGEFSMFRPFMAVHRAWPSTTCPHPPSSRSTASSDRWMPYQPRTCPQSSSIFAAPEAVGRSPHQALPTTFLF